MRTDLFDYPLPADRIALHPARPRDSARLLVVHLPSPRPKGGGALFEDRFVRDLPDLLRPGDALVLNDTRVMPAALEGVRIRGETSAHVSLNLTRRLSPSRWRALARPAKRLAVGDRVRLGRAGSACLMGALDATVSAKGEAGEVELAFDLAGPDLDAAIAAAGKMPLPPYIAAKRPADDSDRVDYQTIFAACEGAVAAPTAGLHFTSELFSALEARGVSRHFVTLHVGPGTFLPVTADDTSGHTMHAEWGEVSSGTAADLNAVRASGGRIVAVGTTSARLLESAATPAGEIQHFGGETSIFITPGYRFRAVDVLMTNFHLPRSTLLMLVAAFSDLETIKAAYSHALGSGYRFYSYGDACLLFGHLGGD
ncbi:MAG TPA: tRNA preQ1(34) S-adenosylmethionine ribosyltransferase-isomerase QueA [Hyphomicrobiaceae bacterium]|nr:tRNA preQ1(34) S-adenosylmethionine ribosyltransferase-isomerase QueA [Hyphomicrobiaceae bacterium]